MQCNNLKREHNPFPWHRTSGTSYRIIEGYLVIDQANKKMLIFVTTYDPIVGSFSRTKLPSHFRPWCSLMVRICSFIAYKALIAYKDLLFPFLKSLRTCIPLQQLRCLTDSWLTLNLPWYVLEDWLYEHVAITFLLRLISVRMSDTVTLHLIGPLKAKSCSLLLNNLARKQTYFFVFEPTWRTQLTKGW